jgi:hypothetical protein
VCSDDTVPDASTRVGDLPTPVTTDPDRIRAWLSTPPASLRLVLCTYASAERLAEAARGVGGGAIDLLIADEGHHLVGDTVSSRVLSSGYLPALRRLIMTATPRGGEIAEDGGSPTTAGMDDSTVFGPVLGSYSVTQGIADGYLRDYRIAVIGVRDSQARRLLSADGVDYYDGPGRQSLQTAAAQVALARAREAFGTRRVLTFHPRVAAAAEFARTLPAAIAGTSDVPRPYAAHVHGGMDQRTRRRILDGLVSHDHDWAVVSSARCLAEGVDLPVLDGVLFAHAKSSVVDITQAVGRILRPDPERRGPSTVIIPLVVPDQSEDIGNLEPGEFATLWEVVRALREHDETLAATLSAARRGSEEATGGLGLELPSKLTILLPPGTSQTVLSQIRLQVVRTSSSAWWRMYQIACAYYQANGHLLPRADYCTADGVRLGAWVVYQRHARRRGLLSAERIDHLTAIGMAWDRAEVVWATGLAAATEYHREHGNLRVSPTYRTTEGFELGRWITNQRNARNLGRSSLTPERIESLTRVGMEWRIDKIAAAWATGLAAARAYYREKGNLDVPFTYRTRDSDYPLGRWISGLRQKRKKGSIAAEQQKLLDDIGMIWDMQEAIWQRGYAAAVEYHRTHGHLEVPVDHVTADGLRLGGWIQTQRRAGNGEAGWTYPPARITLLTALGMRWHRLSTAARPSGERAPSAGAGRGPRGQVPVPGGPPPPEAATGIPGSRAGGGSGAPRALLVQRADI